MATKTVHPFKNHRMPLPMKVFFSATTLIFKILAVVAPTLAGHLALHFFMTPPRFGTPRKEKAVKESATQTFIKVRNRQIAVNTWGEPKLPAVLLSHGWGGRSTQFHAFIKPLVDSGYRVVAFDLPGHGDSEGKKTNMMDSALVIAELAKIEKHFDAVIGHSFGISTLLLAIDKLEVKPDKIVLISYFSDVLWITELFGGLFDLSKTTVRKMREVALNKFKTTYGISWKWEDVSPTHTIKSVTGDILLIHDLKDTEVPYKQAEPLQIVVPNAKVINTTGYGHRKILMNIKVIEEVIIFIRN